MTILMGALFTSLQVGCGKPSPSAEAITHARLDRLGFLYGRYASQHHGQPPKDLATLKKFAEREISAEELSRMGTSDVADMFISLRDNQPFGMATFAKIPAPGAHAPPIVLYEREGQNGLRAVVYLGGGTSEMKAEEFAKAVPSAIAAGHGA
jgi:hypothetical protein